MEGIFIMSKNGHDDLIAKFIERYSQYSEFFSEAVRLKLIKVERLKKGKYKDCGLLITGKEKAIRFFFKGNIYKNQAHWAMWRGSIPFLEIRIKGKIYETIDISDWFTSESSIFYPDDYPVILRLISRILEAIRKEGYLTGDPFSSGFRPLNFDVFKFEVSRSNLRDWIVNIWVANRYLANCIEEALENLPTQEQLIFHIKIGSGKSKPRTLNILPSRQLRRSNSMSKQVNLQPFNTSIPGLTRATFPEFFQFLSEEAKKGRFWMVFDNLTDRCLFLTDNAEPGRLTVPSNQYIGVNRYEAWRDSLDDYHRLKHLLETEKIAPSFEANMYRLDGSFAHFQKTCYLVEGLWGTQCLASVSEGWELVRDPNC